MKYKYFAVSKLNKDSLKLLLLSVDIISLITPINLF